ncbi:hypothetical protein CMK22_07875 [Candidatus Poribacteria bacterium]|nr:hypothetical protein [Candidatus Poribacteria bacterium]
MSLSINIKEKLEEAIALHLDGQVRQAEQIYKQILRINSQDAEVLHLLGVVALQAKKYEVAVELIKHAIKIDSQQSSFFNNLSLALIKQGKLEEAVHACQQALKLEPEDAGTYYNLGIALQKLEKLDEALIIYQKAIKIQPNNAEIHNNLGAILWKQGKLDESIQAYQNAIKTQPNYAEAYNNLGNALQEQGKLDESIQAYQNAIKTQPNYAGYYSNLGNILQEQGKLDESIQAHRNAIKIQPNYAGPYNNLGNVLHEQGKLDESIQAYQNAIKIQPNYAEPHNNLGNVLREQGKLDESIQAYQNAIKIQPNYAEPHNNLGQTLLLTGNLHQGWKEYEWRWECKDFSSEIRYFPQVLWEGSDLKDKSILVWAEQGVGDQIMFASMLHDLSHMEANIITDCDIRLIPLFKRAFPKIQIFPRDNPPVQQLLDTNIDYQIPIGSLGRWLRSTTKNFKVKNQSYLQACPEKSAKLKKKYKKLAGNKPLIGISWKSRNQNFGEAKSTPLKFWIPILSRQDCFFINLQYGNVKQEIEEHISNKSDISLYLDNDIDPLENLDDFAAQVAALDLVISTSNATVHMAGALGKTVWNLLRYMPSWRWMLNKRDTLWYPSMKLFRQNKIRDWLSTFTEVELALDRHLHDAPQNNNRALISA